MDTDIENMDTLTQIKKHREDSLTESQRASWYEHVIKQYPKEAVGVIIDDQYWPLVNHAEDPTRDFRILAIDVVEYRDATIFLHSHPFSSEEPPKYNAAWPSSKDMETWMTSNWKKWGIVGTDGHGVTEEVWLDDEFTPPLLERPFQSGIMDCYSVIRDWYYEHGTDLMNFPRGMDWWMRGGDLYSENFLRAGFQEVNDQPKIGDVFLYRIPPSPVICHGAVYTGLDEITHHLVDRLSTKDRASRWQRFRVKHLRYKWN